MQCKYATLIAIMFEIMVEKSFSAAHFLENYIGPCANMHGHNYRVQVFAKGEKLDDKIGFLLDFRLVKKALDTIIKKLDHKVLNDILDFNTTAELLAHHFFKLLAQKFSNRITISKVTIWETPTCSASYYE